jgi:hypothetical protein
MKMLFRRIRCFLDYKNGNFLIKGGDICLNYKI